MTKLNEGVIEALPIPERGHRLHYFTGATAQKLAAPRGFAVRVTAAGVKSFVLRYHAAGHDRLLTIGRCSDWSVGDAVREARNLRQRIDRCEDPLAAREAETAVARNTLGVIVGEYVTREGVKLRTAEWRQRVIERLILPEFGKMPIDAIRRSDIIRWLDRVEDQNGQVMADRTLAILRKILNWHAARSDDYRSPIVRGMSRANSKTRQRQRILTDDELARIWHASGNTPFGRFVRFSLLTACRRGEAAGMTRDEVADGLWTLPGARHKNGQQLIRPLSAAAQATLSGGQEGPYFFGGQNPVRGFTACRLALDQRAGVSGWCPHDLRRTARSLLSRAGVTADIAEKCLGHAVGGVRAVYDRHDYIKQMGDAYDALANLIARIVDPIDNVEPIRRARS